MKTLLIATIVCSMAGSVLAQTPAPAASAPAASSAGADVTGTWNATFTTTNGEIPAELKLTRTGTKITGTIASQMGQSTVEAEQKEKAVTIWFSMAGQNGPLAIELTATLDGDTLKGSTMAAGSPAGVWVATRAKPEPSDAKTPAAPAAAASAPAAGASLTGAWSLSVELPNMTATPTMVLKQEGEKLTGEYVSAQYGKFPITGTVKGTDVNFSFPMTVEGTGLTVTYLGKVGADGTITGSVTYGDMMNGTFTATKNK
jgi:hypothetical protein